MVLVVDDVADNLLAFRGILERDDVDLVTAGSGRAALEILLERDVAVAIIDVQMPEMDGYELATLMRSVDRTRSVPIIFVTAGSRDGARVFKGYEVGAVDYLFKPVDDYVLRCKVDTFVTLDKQRRELREADRMRELFIAVLGHDLRSPLGGIMTSVELLTLDAQNPRLDTRLPRILRNANRMRRMIDQLLDAARFRAAGGARPRLAPCDLHRLTQQVMGDLDHAAERLSVAVNGSTRGTWDPDMMLQILSNLLGNAVSHSPPSSPVTVHLDGSHRDRVVVQVHNEGDPIPDDLRDQLFEPFRRHDLHPRGREGLGLGLYITHNLARAHGGTLTFTSDEAQGTRFMLTCPRHAGAPETT